MDAGDFSATRIQPEGYVLPSSDTFALDGVQLRWIQGDDRGFTVFAGASKFLLALPGTRARRPFIAGGEYFLRHDRDFFDAGLTVIDHPVYADPSVHHDSDAIARFSYLRRVSPLALAFADGYAGRGAGLRAGATLQSQLANATVSFYDFSSQLPLLSSFNPGERGINASGSYRPTELSTLSSQLFFVDSDTQGGRRDLRGEIEYGQSLGSNAPYISVGYAREQLTADTLDEDVSRVADRVSASVTRSWLSGYSSLQIDRVINRGDGTPDTTQLLATQHQVLGTESFFDGTLVIQGEPGRWGTTLESAIETPWRSPYYFLYGLGAAYVTGSAATGEGVLRFGITRRVFANGPYGRIEARIPVSIGLPRSHLNRNLFSVDLGTRFGWRDLRSVQSVLAPLLTPNQFGSITGRVTLDGKGAADVGILVNGESAGQTDGSGAFRISRAAVGPANVAIDVARLEPGLSVVGEASRDVVVPPRQPVNVEFAIARYTTLRGSFVICENDRPRAVGGAHLALLNGSTALTFEVSPSGNFQVDQIPPAEYEIVIDPTTTAGIAAVDLPRLRADLRHDLLGFVIGIHCPAAVTARARAAAVPSPVSPETAQPSPEPWVPPVAVAASPIEPEPAIASPAPSPAVAQPVANERATTFAQAAQLVIDGEFAEAAMLFGQLGPIEEPRFRYFHAIALYETGRYADAKREVIGAEVPQTLEAARYVAKIEGAIVR